MRYIVNENKELVKLNEDGMLNIKTPWVKYILHGYDKKMKRDTYIFVGGKDKFEVRLNRQDASIGIFPAIIINKEEKDLLGKVDKLRSLIRPFAKSGSDKDLKKISDYVGYELKILEKK